MIVENFTLEEVVKFSRHYALKESPKATRILDFNVDKSIRDYLNLCFTYLRFVDNYIDNPSTPVCEKRKLIDEQKRIISLLTNGNPPKNLVAGRIEVACLFYFSDYAIKGKNIILMEALQKMINALEMDVCRLEDSGIFSNDEFDRYIKLMAKSLHNILHFFFSSDPLYLSEEFYLNVFTANAQMIRDMEEDIDAGFINISREDIEYYKLNISNLKNDKNLSFWLKHRVNYLWKILYTETARLKYSPLKIRIFIYYSLIYYMTWIVRSKVYNYNIKAYTKKTFIRELKTYFLSLLKSVEIFFRGFVFPLKIEKARKINSLSLSKPEISLNEASGIAGTISRKRAPKLWLISHLMIPNEKRKYVFLSFSYLRWVDDFVDNPFNIGKLEFVENQLKLLSVLTKSNLSEYELLKERISNENEFFLYYCIRYAKLAGNCNPVYEGKRNLEAIKMDAARLQKQGIFTSEELNFYIDKLVGSIFNLSYYLFYPSMKIKEDNSYLGRFLQQVLMLRDFFEDLDSGYINISREDVEKYNIDINNIREDKNLISLMIDKYNECFKILEDDIKVLKSLPIKLKLFWHPIYPYMISELIRIKIYDYNFGVIYKKLFFKEIRLYMESFWTVMKFYFKVVFKKHF